MTETLTLTDSDLLKYLEGDRPLLLIVSTGEGLRGDFVAAFNKAAAQNKDIVFARVNPAENPQARSRFNAGEKPLMIGWLNGQEVVRRNRPWGTDVTGAVEALRQALPASHPASPDRADEMPAPNSAGRSEKDKPMTLETTPFTATDDNFQREVIDYDLPVLVDFWAPWCGPCRQVAPILDKLAVEFAGKIRIAKVNVDENPRLSQSFQVMSIPTLMMIKERTIVFNQPGALPEPVLRDLIQQLIALEIPPQDQATPESGD